MALDAGNKKLIRIRLGVLNEVRWGLLCWNCNQWNALIRGLKPHNLGTINRTARFIAAVPFAFTSFSFLLLLSGGRRWSEEP